MNKKLRTLTDLADYLATQLRLLEKGEKHYCCRCGKELERVYYRIPDLCGEYCDTCIHKIYRIHALTFFAVDREDK